MPVSPSSPHSSFNDSAVPVQNAESGQGPSRVRRAAEQIGRDSPLRQRVEGPPSPESRQAYLFNLRMNVARLLPDVLHFQDAHGPIAQAFGNPPPLMLTPEQSQEVKALLPLSRLWHSNAIEDLPARTELVASLRPHLADVDTYYKNKALQTILNSLQLGSANLNRAKALRVNQLLRVALDLQPAIGQMPVDSLKRLSVRILNSLCEMERVCSASGCDISSFFDPNTMNECRAEKLRIMNRLEQSLHVSAPEFRAQTAEHVGDIEILKYLLAYDPEFPFPDRSIPTSKQFWMEFANDMENPMLNGLPPSLFNQIDLIDLVLQKNPLSYPQFPEALRVDPRVVTQALTQWGINLEHAPQNFRNDPASVTIAVGQSGPALQFASAACRANPQIVLAAAQQNSQSLQYADPLLLGNDEFMQTVIQINPNCFSHASATLRANPQLIQTAIAHEGLNFRYLSEADRRKPAYIQLALSKHGAAIEFVPYDVAGYLNYARFSFAHTPQADRARMLLRVNPEWLNNRELVLAAAQVDGESIDIGLHDLLETGGTQAQHDAFRALVANDREIIEAAIHTHGFSLVLANETMKQDPELFAIALHNSPDVLEIASEERLNNVEFARAVIHRHAATCDELVEYFSEGIQSNAELMLLAIRLNPASYEYVADILQEDLNFSIQAMQQNAAVYHVLNPDHQHHHEILRLRENHN